MSELVCRACGARFGLAEPYPFRCPAAGTDDRDHVLERRLGDAAFETQAGDPNPFVRFRQRLHSYWFGREHGFGDAAFVALVRELDARVAAVDGKGAEGFHESPYVALSAVPGPPALGVWAKNETDGVAGSHKARHLFAVLLQLEVAERVGLVAREARPPLAIASCGNAALAAATLARAADRRLLTFVPPHADVVVLDRLRKLGAELVLCERVPEAAPGDPCTHAFHAALADGALPFSCQGSENALVIEGGATLGYELALQHATASERPLARVFVQVGGGALASACVLAFEEARAHGIIERMPRLHCVQAVGGHPLERAWQALVARGVETEAAGRAALTHALSHRSEFMWPWSPPPASVASGILDDETYDWFAIVRAMLETGGGPVVASEAGLASGWRTARAISRIPVCATGAAGFAGMLEFVSQRECEFEGQDVAVLFTGVER